MERVLHEDQGTRSEHPDRWSKDLVGGEVLATTSGFSIGVAEYHTPEFGELQVHADQEAVYVVSGVGEICIGDSIHRVRPEAQHTFLRTPNTRRVGPEMRR